jgi:hypothetical protein
MARELVENPAPAAGPAVHRAPLAPFLRANRVTLLAAAAAVGLAVAVYASSPRQHGVTSLWMLLLHLTPFVAATVAIAWLDLGWARRLRLPLILPPSCFLVFFTFFVPYIFFLFARNDAERYFDRLYYTQLIMVPFVILSLVLAVRLGGAGRSTVVRLASAMLLLQLSGIEDLAVMVIRDANLPGSQPIPAVWDWADHMAVRLGHYPTRNEAYAFIAVHVAASVAVLAAPGRLVRSLVRPVVRAGGTAVGRLSRRRPEDPA